MKRFPIILILLACLTSSCSLFQDPKEQALVDIEDEFRIDVWQKLEPGTNPLEMVISTILPPSCLDSEIRLTKSQRSNAVFLGIFDVINPSNCEPTNTNITTSALYFLNDGDYDFDIDLRLAIVNKGRLIVTPDSYSIEMESEDGIVFGRSEIRRIPDGKMWGTIKTEFAENQHLLHTFLNDIGAIANSDHGLSTGDYGYFRIDNASDLVLPDFESTAQHRSFIFDTRDNDNLIRSFIADFRDAHPTITIEGIDAQGKVL